MLITHQDFHTFLEENEINNFLYGYLDDNEDQFFGNYGEDVLAIMYEAYRIYGGILTTVSTENNINAYIEYVYKEYPSFDKVILAIIWTVLSLHSDANGLLRHTIYELRKELTGYKPFHLFNHFVSAARGFHGNHNVRIPQNPIIIVSEAVDGSVALIKATQNLPSPKSFTNSTIHQTLVFPHVEQFNNNPSKVINNIQKK